MIVAAVDTSSGQRDEGVDAKTQWLQTIQGNVKEAMKGKKGLYNWTDFINKVVLHFKDKSKHDNWIVALVAVLFDYGITEQADLEVADRVVLKNHLERDRVPLIMADILFKYVASDQAAADFTADHQTPNSTPTRKSAPRQHPPSTGKTPANNLPADKSPSSEDGKQQGLRAVSENSLPCSSNSVALRLYKRIYEITHSSTEIEDVYVQAQMHILRAIQSHELMLSDVKQIYIREKNERYFTNAFCEAMNLVLPRPFVCAHQSSIGSGTTHSDISIRPIRPHATTTYSFGGVHVVGEAKPYIGGVHDVRGQQFNEVLRHRSIDLSTQNRIPNDFRPFLVLAIDENHLVLDLAFPSRKNGFMETSGWVKYDSSVAGGDETFWITPLMCVHFNGNSLAKALKAIVNSIDFLHGLNGVDRSRPQFKTPWIDSPSSVIVGAERQGDNVTIVKFDDGNRLVYKEFCYHLREIDNFNYIRPDLLVSSPDQRRAPPKDLLEALGSPYNSWEVNEIGEIRILSYPYIDGTNTPPTFLAWIAMLTLVQKLHNAGYVHGDILQRNLLFHQDRGYIIDFDLTRKEGEHYVAGFNHVDFQDIRHRSASERQPMKKSHDVYSLRKLAERFFGGQEVLLQDNSINHLIAWCHNHQSDFNSNSDVSPHPLATGSPNRTMIQER